MTEAFLRLEQVQQIVPLSRTEIYRRIQAGTFPKQLRISHKVALWPQSKINEWVEEQKAKFQ